MIGVLLIATRKYKIFVQPLLEQLDKYFLTNKEKTIFLFTDELKSSYVSASKIVQLQIDPFAFPFATLYRYRIFSEHEKSISHCLHTFYLDVDMGIVAAVGNEILGEGLTVVRHPGFFGLGGWGANRVNPESRAFIPVERRDKYFAGGFQGGAAEVFLKMSKELAVNIAEDEMNGIIAEHNDEAHLNHYVYSHPEIPRIELDPSYCMVQSEYLRENWKIDHLKPRIIALDKDHKTIRE